MELNWVLCSEKPATNPPDLLGSNLCSKYFYRDGGLESTNSEIVEIWVVLCFLTASSFAKVYNVCDGWVSMEHWWNDSDRQKPKYLEKNVCLL